MHPKNVCTRAMFSRIDAKSLLVDTRKPRVGARLLCVRFSDHRGVLGIALNLEGRKCRVPEIAQPLLGTLYRLELKVRLDLDHEKKRASHLAVDAVRRLRVPKNPLPLAKTLPREADHHGKLLNLAHADKCTKP